MSRIVATFFLVGLLRPAPGSWGSLAAIPAAWVLWLIGSWWLLALAIPAVFFAGLWATDREYIRTGHHDASEIVVDEVAGQWIALLPVAYGASFADVSFWALWPGILSAFLAFRLFDIWKPGPIRKIDEKIEPIAVMLDDLVAGLFAALLVIVLGVLWHVLFLF